MRQGHAAPTPPAVLGDPDRPHARLGLDDAVAPPLRVARLPPREGAASSSRRAAIRRRTPARRAVRRHAWPVHLGQRPHQRVLRPLRAGTPLGRDSPRPVPQPPAELPEAGHPAPAVVASARPESTGRSLASASAHGPRRLAPRWQGRPPASPASAHRGHGRPGRRGWATSGAAWGGGGQGVSASVHGLTGQSSACHDRLGAEGARWRRRRASLVRGHGIATVFKVKLGLVDSFPATSYWSASSR